MPYRSRRRFTRFRRRRPIRFGGRGRRRGFRSPWRAIRSINKRLTSEVKKADTALLDPTIDSAGVTANLTTIAQGDTSSTRTANQIQLKYLTCTGFVTLGVEATGANQVRVVIAQDTKQVADTTPTVAEIVGTGSPSSLYTATAMTTGRFNLIYDKVFRNVGVAAGTLQTFPLRFTRRLDRKPFIKVKYNGAANTDYDNGSIVVFVIAQTDEIGAIDANFRLGFYDN